METKLQKLADELKCQICFLDYGDLGCAACTLDCGHSLCTKCVAAIKNFKCPFCRRAFQKMVPSYTIMNLANILNPKGQPASATFQILCHFEKIFPSRIRKINFGFHMDSNKTVIKIEANSMAFAANLQIGDQIIGVNDQDVAKINGQEFLDLLDKFKFSLILKVNRK